MLILGGILLYRSYALYEEEKEFNVLKGQVPPFHQGDIQLTFTIDGVPGNNFPDKSAGLIAKNVTCEKEGVTAEWDDDLWGLVNVHANGNKKVNCSIDFESHDFNLAGHIIKISETNSDIEKVTHEETEQTPALTDYRYTGKDPDNYVCFGYEGERCPDENLYRIIGVIPTQSSENGAYENRVKLIRNEYYMNENAVTTTYSPIGKGYLWNTTKNNKWEESSLKEELNTSYWNSLGEYQKYIEKAKWYLGAMNQDQGRNYSTHQFYKEERSNTQGYSKGVTSYINHIGLLYLSDLGFSISKTFWNNSMYSSTVEYKSNAWVYDLHGGTYYEWIISPETSTYNEYGTLSWGISAEGASNVVAVNYGTVQAFAIRPTFYLKTSVTYKKGEGTIDNPYYLNI